VTDTRVLPPLVLASSDVDRAALHRLDDGWLAAAWQDPATRVLIVSDARAAVTGDDELLLVPPASAPDGERLFLGTDPAGFAHFAVLIETPVTTLRFAGLREVGTALSDRQAGLLVHALGLESWHRAHGYCARCGERTAPAAAGHVRRCPSCGTEHYPRTDPAVIMLIRDADDRCLLGRRQVQPVSRWSTLAGFVEPGESLEQAVIREVAEEAGVAVDSVEYVASQPWPFPSSIMLGFLGRAADPRTEVDGEEIAEARWFSRAELRAAVEAGEVLLPTGLSIARRLVELWYGAPLPEKSVSR
jgi:NAD+ diphosphatase